MTPVPRNEDDLQDVKVKVFKDGKLISLLTQEKRYTLHAFRLAMNE